MSYTHINIEERACIKKMKSERSSIRAIARYLGRSPSTISREINRNKDNNGVYHPVTLRNFILNVKIIVVER